ncbi:MAG: hypothetical protein ABJA78_07910 [Ferruginibacter sp.]
MPPCLSGEKMMSVNDNNIDYELLYRQAVAAKESFAKQLEEVNYLLEVKEEHIALLEKKAAIAAQLQSKLDGESVETQSLREMMEEQKRKAAGTRTLKNELEEELVLSLQTEKKYLALQETHFHTNNELIVLQSEIKELVDLNKDLLTELEKMGEMQSRIEILQIENNELKAKLL